MSAAQQWRDLAQQQLEWAEYLEKRGEFGGTHRNRAKTYEDTAKSLDLEAEHGEPFCVCHLKPMREMREADARRPVRR